MRGKGFLARVLTLWAGKGIHDGMLALILLWLARTDQSGYGLFVFGAGVASMVRAALALGLDQYSLREFSLNEQPRAPLLSQMARIKTVLGGLSLAGLAAFGLLKGWGSIQTVVVMVIVLGQIMEGVADTFFNLFRAEGRQVREGIYRAVANLIGGAYGVVCLLMGLGVVALSFFFVISNGLKIIAVLAGVKRLGLAPAWHKNGGLIPTGQIRVILTIAGVSVLGMFYNSIQIFLLKQFHTLTEVAVYGAAFDLTSGFSGLVAHIIVGAVLFPTLVAAAAKGQEYLAGRVRAYFWQLITYGIGLAFFLSTLGCLVLTTLYGVKYTASVVPLRILGPATLLSFVNNFGVYVLLALKQERRLLLFHLLPAFLSLGLGLWLIPALGPTGAAINLLACRIVMCILILGSLQRQLAPIVWPELKNVLKASLSMAIIYLAMIWFEPFSAALAGLLTYVLVIRYSAGGSSERSRGRVSEI